MESKHRSTFWVFCCVRIHVPLWASFPISLCCRMLFRSQRRRGSTSEGKARSKRDEVVVGQARGRGTESQTKPRLLCSNITSTLKIRDFLCLTQLLSRNPTECHRARYSTVSHQAVNHQDILVPRTALLAHGITRHLCGLSRCFTR